MAELSVAIQASKIGNITKKTAGYLTLP